MSNTLEDVLIGLTMHGADRGALVRHGTPGVLVLLTSKAAVQRIGPGLVDILRDMGDSGKREIGQCDSNARLNELFDLTDNASANGWAWFEMPFGTMTVVAAVITGQPWCDRVAAHCTANGAPCSLDPTKAAPGYEIIERHQRK
jgi:hypothetical protein